MHTSTHEAQGRKSATQSWTIERTETNKSKSNGLAYFSFTSRLNVHNEMQILLLIFNFYFDCLIDFKLQLATNKRCNCINHCTRNQTHWASQHTEHISIFLHNTLVVCALCSFCRKNWWWSNSKKTRQFLWFDLLLHVSDQLVLCLICFKVFSARWFNTIIWM